MATPPAGLRLRFWAEATLATLTGALAVITLFWQDWIEAVFHVDPDGGNGSAEWVVVAVLLATTVALAVTARAEWRRAQLTAG